MGECVGVHWLGGGNLRALLEAKVTLWQDSR